METKKDKIKKLAVEMLNDNHSAMIQKIDRALNCGVIDPDTWDDCHNFMILPKCILIAVLEDAATQYSASGTIFEKQIKKDVKNIRLFI